MKFYSNLSKNEWSALIKRPTNSIAELECTVKEIFKEVEKKGDIAIEKYTSFFDGITLSDFRVSNTEIEEANNLVSKELKQTIQVAKSNIEKFHAAQKTSKIEIETMKGVLCWQEKRPIPGGL